MISLGLGALAAAGLYVSLAWPSLVAHVTAPLTGLGGSRPIATPGHPLRVLLIGDSLSWEAREPFVTAITKRNRATVQSDVFGGTALCDFLPGLPADLARFKPQAAVLEFAGNQFTRCTKDGAGRPLSREALIAKYGQDAATAAVLFRDAGVAVYWADVPPSRSDDGMGRQVLDAVLRASASVTPTTLIDAAQAVLKNGAYTETLPCESGEPCTPVGPDHQRLARVRSPDGGHFCPAAAAGGFGEIRTCPTFSPGAWRYGRAMAAPLIRRYHL